MKLCVFGGTGKTGSHVIRVAKSKGYDIVALARRPGVLEAMFPGIHLFPGDVYKPQTIKAIVSESDAVISTLGPVGGTRQTTIYSVGVVNIARAMEELGKRRLIVVASLIGIDPHPDASCYTRIFAKLILQPILGYQYRDTAKMKDLLTRFDSLDLTLVGLPRLTDGKPKNHFRSSIGAPLHHPSTISRADLAQYLVSIIEEAKTYKQWAEVSW
jgi:putative NADH-flavin reductase